MVLTKTTRFNAEQQAVYNAVITSVTGNHGFSFFIQSAGGCGKTFVCNTIAAAVHAQGKVVLCVASSGIAALLLTGGCTAHSRFKIPINIHEDSFCAIKKGTDLHKVLQHTQLVIWDEVPMQHRHCIEALDRSLQDLLTSNKPFGGITFLFGGDFRQTLPVIPKASQEQIVGATLHRSALWSNVQILHLSKNMRLHDGEEEWANFLLDIGNGRYQTSTNPTATLPNGMRCGDNVESLINFVYPNLKDSNTHSDQFFLERAILSCRNDDVDDLNHAILSVFPGDLKLYHSSDKIVQEEGADAAHAPVYPVEFLNSLKPAGLPLSKLCLKVGCPLMLLCNLDPSKGLCNCNS